MLQARAYPSLPGIMFGGLSIGVGLLALFLPETLNRPLPQTIEDIDAWGREPAKETSPMVHLSNQNRDDTVDSHVESLTNNIKDEKMEEDCIA